MDEQIRHHPDVDKLLYSSGLAQCHNFILASIPENDLHNVKVIQNVIYVWPHIKSCPIY